MSELVSAAINVETPLSTEDTNKDIMLRKLQNRIYFEKRVAASNAPNYTEHCTMALPAWFVTKHGDKFRQSVLLRSGSSTEPWRVELSLSHRPPRTLEVKFSGGWRTFAAVNDLVVGYLLIFSLRAMSEFDVYVCRETDSAILIQPSSTQAPRKRSCDFELSKEKVITFVGCRHQNLVVERSKGRAVSEMEKDKARTGSGVHERPRDCQGKIFFKKTLPAGAVSTRFQLALPTRFVQQHGDKIQKHVILQSVADTKMWINVKVIIRFPHQRPQVVIYGGAWKAFVVSNGLVEGDRLTFTLVAMSKFEVFILRSGGKSKADLPSLQGPVIRSKVSAFSQTWQPTKSLGPQHIDLTGKWSMKLERDMSVAEDSIACSTSDSSLSPSDMDSHFFETMVTKNEQEALSTTFNNTYCQTQN